MNIINNCKRLIKKSSLVKHIMKVVGNSLIRKKQEYLTKNGYSLLNRVFSELKRKNIVAIPVFGTLLGFIREQKFISHDFDIDIAVFIDDEESWSVVNECMINSGFKVKAKYLVNGEIAELAYIETGNKCLRIDIFRLFSRDKFYVLYSCYKKDDYLYDNVNKRHYYTNHLNSNLIISEVCINGFHYPVLECNESNRFLEQVYGSDWIIPKPNWVYVPGPGTIVNDEIAERYVFANGEKFENKKSN